MTPETNYASPTTPTTATDIAPKSFFSRLMGVYFSPGETFKEIGLNPSFIVALLILMLVGGLASYLMIDRITVPKFFSPGFEQAVADGRMQQEQMNQQLEGMNKYALWIKVGFFVVGFIQWAIIPLAVAGLFKLISMLLGTENKFKSVFTVTIYALLAVTILSTVVFLSTLYLKPVDEIDMNNLGASNLGALLTMLLGKDGLPKFIMAFARWVDLFAIWMITLLSIGYAAISHKLKTSTVATALGGLYAVIALIVSAISAIRG